MKEFKDLKGKTIVKIDVKVDNTEMLFTLSDGRKFKMYHEQDCCESVWIDDIIGNLDNLLDSPLLTAECVQSEGCDDLPKECNFVEQSSTWTFYKLSTLKAYVDIRWYGESNGYYSESVDFCEEDCESNNNTD